MVLGQNPLYVVTSCHQHARSQTRNTWGLVASIAGAYILRTYLCTYVMLCYTCTMWTYYIYISVKSAFCQDHKIHHKHQGLGHLARSVWRVTAALANVSSVSRLFSFLVDFSGMILKGFGCVALKINKSNPLIPQFTIYHCRKHLAYTHIF